MTSTLTQNEARRVLGVRKGASEQEIKKAFRRKARLYHSDTGIDARAELTKICEAKKVLLERKQTVKYISATKDSYTPNYSYRHTYKKKEPLYDSGSCLEALALFMIILSLFITQCN